MVADGEELGARPTHPPSKAAQLRRSRAPNAATMPPMRLRAALFTVVGLAPFATACRSPSESKTKPSAVVSMTPEPLAMRDAESITKDASPEPAPRRKWATYADPKAPLSYVVDGYCAQLMVRASKGGTFAWWGEGTGNIARATDTGLADVAELSRGLPGAYGYGPVIANAEGELFVEANTGGRSSMSSAVYHRGRKGWGTVAETDLYNDAGFSIYQLIGAYGAGALATVSRCNGSCRAAGVVAVGEPTPRIAWEGEAYSQAWVGEDKTVVIGAQRCDAVTPDKCACTARAFLPNGAVKPHAFDAEPCGLSIAGATSRDVFVANGATLGDNVKVQNNVSVYEGVHLGDDVFCGPSMVFTNVVNPRSHVSRKDEYRATRVGRGASFGANCTVVCGHDIGRYAFVAAGAVVTKEIPDFALVMGVPGRVAGYVCQCGVRLPLSPGDAARDLACGSCGWKYRWDGRRLAETA